MQLTDPTYPEARKALEAYPYFAYAALKAIPLAPGKKERDALRRIVAVNIGDPADIREILSLNSESLADFYPDTLPPHLDTFDTIDSFITHYGERPSRPEADNSYADSIECDAFPLHVSPTGASLPDVADSPGDAPADSTSSAIDAFLKAVPPPQPKRPKKLPPTEESPALTESFAKILIKNQNYTKALQIIEDLNLKNPEKSVYFADQIRFLKKLIINQSKQNI